MKHEYNFLHHTCLSRLNLLVLALMLFMAFDISAEELRTGNYTYSGGVTAGKQNGYGVCRYTNGTTYYGYWNMGYKEGLGRMVYADGTIEFGTWKHGKYVKPKGIKFIAGLKVYGIDVSKYQKTVDWTKLSLKANASGKVPSGKTGGSYQQPVLFALMKSTQGTTIKDPTFERNFREAKRCGIIRGAYHFLSVSSPVEDQVKYFIANTPLEAGDLPPVLDLEIDKATMQKQHDKVVKMAKKWLELVEKHYGVRPIIYTYNNYYNDYLKGHGLDDYDYWIARYGAEPSARHWEIWQFTETGVCAGIDHAVDIDLFKCNFQDLQDYVKLKGVHKNVGRSRRPLPK